MAGNDLNRWWSGSSEQVVNIIGMGGQHGSESPPWNGLSLFLEMRRGLICPLAIFEHPLFLLLLFEGLLQTCQGIFTVDLAAFKAGISHLKADPLPLLRLAFVFI